MKTRRNILKVRPRFVNFITFGFAAAITLWPFGIYFIRKTGFYSPEDKVLVNHEMIHWRQSGELIGIFFYLFYFIEWLIKLFFYGSRSYYNLSFEREAKNNERNFNYLKERKMYSWVKYIFKK